jgi:hypothetical protein
MVCKKETKEKIAVEIKINPPISNLGNLSSRATLLLKKFRSAGFRFVFHK